MKRALPLILMTVILSACAAQKGGHKAYLERRGIAPETSIEEFAHCRGYGCKHIDQVSLSKSQWREIDRIFRYTSKTPKAERAKIAKAIGVFETTVGDITGTHVDQYGTFIKLGTYQQDCVDESTNTTIYLDMLESKGFLKHHGVSSPAVRLPIINSGRWPHQAATIIENETSARFVVDSWFHNNGAPAEIVPLKTWKSGWKPEKN